MQHVFCKLQLEANIEKKKGNKDGDEKQTGGKRGRGINLQIKGYM